MRNAGASKMSSFFRFILLGLCLSLLYQWSDDGWKEGGEETQTNKTSCNLAVKHLLLGHLRKTRLWRRVVGETRHSRGKGRPAWFLLGILLLSGDVELNPGPNGNLIMAVLAICTDHDCSLSPVIELSDISFLPILNWFEVGVALNLKEYELKVIESDHKGDLKRQKMEMLQLWLDQGEEATYEALVKALLKTDNVGAALELYHTKGIVIYGAEEIMAVNGPRWVWDIYNNYHWPIAISYMGKTQLVVTVTYIMNSKRGNSKWFKI